MRRIKIKKILFIVLVLTIGFSLSGLAQVSLATTKMESDSYKLEAINFGQDVVLYSTQDSILPSISGEGPQVSNIKATSVVITWATDKSSSSIVNFGATTNYGAQMGNFTEKVKDHTVYLTGLTPNTTYHYKVASEDRAGNIGESEDKTFATPKEPAVSGLQITDITLNSAIVSFETATIVHATIKYGTTTNYGAAIEEDSGSYTTQHTIRFANLTQGTIYNVKISGVDEQGEQVNSDNYTFSTLPLPAVFNLSIKDINANTATVYWTTNTDTDSLVEYYTQSDIEVAGIKKGEKLTAGSATRSKEHSIKLTSLIGNTVYYYKVFSQDQNSNRVESGQAVFTTSKDTTPPEISKVKTNTNLDQGETSKVQLTVTWETDEPSTSQVGFGLGANPSGKDKESVEDTVYTTSHYAILQDLAPSSTYRIKAISRDPYNNLAESKSYTILTPKKRRSLIQLIAEKLDETFGWMKKVKF
ncbi:MAG: fibronectin type III domain-containing protein [Candidatus Berkelbacteria bacterium Licking1014_7]|uniref:Fibronectin type III domain-containing protein n=1 Tax=Candidatus Berkelbacteria bacterium Licking1014_7 TaxID=2017147 RepID=A0A554LIZ4_9BACT|nr:MAG: fibronectin type III domain-containing protein [Candidatus Berkelbacteria bacterium Licking1014_7]